MQFRLPKMCWIVRKWSIYYMRNCNEWGFRQPLCTYRLNLARRTSWGYYIKIWLCWRDCHSKHETLNQCWLIVGPASHFNFQSLEVVDRVSETQLQVGENSNATLSQHQTSIGSACRACCGPSCRQERLLRGQETSLLKYPPNQDSWQMAALVRSRVSLMSPSLIELTL